MAMLKISKSKIIVYFTYNDYLNHISFMQIIDFHISITTNIMLYFAYW